jgi:hypothetical protein
MSGINFVAPLPAIDQTTAFKKAEEIVAALSDRIDSERPGLTNKVVDRRILTEVLWQTGIVSKETYNMLIEKYKPAADASQLAKNCNDTAKELIQMPSIKTLIMGVKEAVDESGHVTPASKMFRLATNITSAFSGAKDELKRLERSPAINPKNSFGRNRF